MLTGCLIGAPAGRLTGTICGGYLTGLCPVALPRTASSVPRPATSPLASGASMMCTGGAVLMSMPVAASAAGVAAVAAAVASGPPVLCTTTDASDALASAEGFFFFCEADFVAFKKRPVASRACEAHEASGSDEPDGHVHVVSAAFESKSKTVVVHSSEKLYPAACEPKCLLVWCLSGRSCSDSSYRLGSRAWSRCIDSRLCSAALCCCGHDRLSCRRHGCTPLHATVS